jgi:PST family polysaccharide transporter
MSLKQKTVKGLIWSFAQKWGGHIISFGTFTLLARLLDPQDFGLVAMAGVFIAFMKVFLDQGFASAIVQRKNLDPEHLDTAFWFSLASSLGLFVISAGTASWVANFYREPQLAPVIQVLSINFLFKAFNSVQTAILSRDFQFKSLAVRSLIAMIAGGVIGISMAVMGYGVWSLVGQQLAIGFIEIIVLWSVSNWRPAFRFSWKHLHDLLSFGINVMGMNGLTFLNRYSDNLLIGYFLGAEALGYYAVAYRVLMVLTDLLTKTTVQVALPAFSRLQDNLEKMRHAFYQATQLSSLIAFPSFLGIAVLAPIIVPTVFGPQWMQSVPVMQILATIGMLYSIGFFNGAVMMAMGKPSWSLQIKVLNTAVTVMGFMFVLRQGWGAIGVASALVVVGYMLFPVSVWAIHKLIHIDLMTYLRQYIGPVAASLVMCGSIWGAMWIVGDALNVAVALVLYIALGIAVYGAAIFLFAPKLFRQLLTLMRLVMPMGSKSRT